MQQHATSATHSYFLLDCAPHDGAFEELRMRFPQTQRHSLFQGNPEQELLEASPLLLAIASQPMGEELALWLSAFERAACSPD